MKIEARIHLQVRATEYSDPYFFTRRVELNTPPFKGSIIVVDYGSYKYPTQIGLVIDYVEDLVFTSKVNGIYPRIEVFCEDWVDKDLLAALRYDAAKRLRGWRYERLGEKKAK